jgi:DNA-binding transcriptional ArsR family regulator
MRTFPPVRIVHGDAFERVAELAAFTSGPARASLDAGKPWVRDVRAAAGPELLGRVERFALNVFAELASVALETPPPRDARALVAAIEAFEPESFQRRILGADSAMSRSMLSDGAIERAIGGDRAAAAELRALTGADRTARRSLDRALSLAAAELRSELAGIVRDWDERVAPRFADASRGAVERDLATREPGLGAGEEADRALVTAVTRGVTYEPPAWIRQVVLIPVVATRPFVIPLELRETAVFLVPVSDEAFETDPAAPPHQLVKLAAAMGDELRLRALRLLRDDALTASEIAERLGVDRTSMHHHLGILRSAGLLAIHDEGVKGWRYSVRDDSIRGVGAALDAYLRAGPD